MSVILYAHCKHCRYCSIDHPFPCEDSTCKEGQMKLPTEVIKNV